MPRRPQLPDRTLPAAHLLRATGIPFAGVGQGDVEQWAAANPGHLSSAVTFLRWARRHRLTPSLDLPTQVISTPQAFAADEQHWAIARRCLTDTTASHRLRLVGALVLLYGQHATAITRLRRTDVTGGQETRIRLGGDAITLDEPLATVATELAAATVSDTQPRGLARAFNADGDGWLFPGRGPGKPLGDAAIRADLAKLGITTRAGRNTALLAIARDVPPSVLGDLLGVSATTAERWRQYAGGAWSTYAAEAPPTAPY